MRASSIPEPAARNVRALGSIEPAPTAGKPRPIRARALAGTVAYAGVDPT
jgi:hypothetical protein